ncbi:putative phage tail protein [Sporosarcina sp. A2]|uniref:putative phage tail protein n=1 Tax=Sporosarcina sp. A2 TaxID=3393449 RepID=UPI003D7BFA12
MFNEADIRERLIYAIPLWWQEIREMKNMQDQSTAELVKYVNEYYRYVDSRSPLTADALKIVRWEVVYGIEPNPNKPISERRSVVTAKIRGVGTVTPALVKFTAESFEFGQVEVLEDEGGVTITFVSELGVPPDLDDIRKALRDLIPAHLMIDFVFKYVTYDMASEHYATYDELIAQGRTYDEVLNGGF